MNGSLEQSAQPKSEKPPMLQLTDPTPERHWELRVDLDGNIWRWEPSHHTLEQEAQIQAAGDDYWQQRLTVNSDDAEAEAAEASAGVEERVDAPVPEGMAWHWQFFKKAD